MGDFTRITDSDGKTWAISNPGEIYHGSLYAFHFGAYGWSALLVWADSVESALEEAAGFCADHWPGHIVSETEHNDLIKEACDEAGIAWPAPDSLDIWGGGEGQPWQDAIESAEADLTYTESGWLTSYEWTVDDVDADEPLYALARDASPCDCGKPSTTAIDGERWCDECALEVYSSGVEELIWWTIQVAEGEGQPCAV